MSSVSRRDSLNPIKSNQSSKQSHRRKILEDEVYKQQALSEDEIKRLTIEEGLTETQRCLILLKKPDHEQQSYVFRNWKSIFKGDLEAQKELIPKILQIIDKSSEMLLVEAGQAFNFMLRDIVVEDEEIIKQIHHTASKVLTTWSQAVLFEWRQVFKHSMRVLSNYELRDSIEIAMKLCDKTQPLVTRINGAYLLGKTVRYFTPNHLPIGWAQKVSIMSQDFNFEVRQEIAKQFKSIYKHISVEDLNQSKLLERYLELLSDEEEDVKSVSIRCLPWVLQKLTKDKVESLILPILKKTLVEGTGKVRTTLLNQMGRFSESLHQVELFKPIEDELVLLIQESFIDNGKKVDEDDLNLEIYKGLNQVDLENILQEVPDQKISEWQINQLFICYNLPAIAVFVREKTFFQVLYPHIQSLAGNQYINPKLSQVLPQTVLCIKKDKHRAQLLEIICQISNIAINDTDCNLMKNIIQDIPMLYKAFSLAQVDKNYNLSAQMQNHSGHQQFPMTTNYFNTKVSSVIFNIFEASVTEWRAFDSSLEFFKKCIDHISRVDIRDKYLPVILGNLKKSNQSIKIKIIEILVILLTNNPDYQSRTRIHGYVNEELAKSKSIYDRKIYITLCAKICPKISKKYFKEVFAWCFLKISEEKKKDMAIIFAKNIIPIRKKLDDISSISKIENCLMTFKNLFNKDAYITQICQKAYHSITTAHFKQNLKSNQELQNEKQLQIEEQDIKDREKFLLEQDKKREKEIRDSQIFGNGFEGLQSGPYMDQSSQFGNTGRNAQGSTLAIYQKENASAPIKPPGSSSGRTLTNQYQNNGSYAHQNQYQNRQSIRMVTGMSSLNNSIETLDGVTGVGNPGNSINSNRPGLFSGMKRTTAILNPASQHLKRPNTINQSQIDHQNHHEVSQSQGQGGGGSIKMSIPTRTSLIMNDSQQIQQHTVTPNMQQNYSSLKTFGQNIIGTPTPNQHFAHDHVDSRNTVHRNVIVNDGSGQITINAQLLNTYTPQVNDSGKYQPSQDQQMPPQTLGALGQQRQHSSSASTKALPNQRRYQSRQKIQNVGNEILSSGAYLPTQNSSQSPSKVERRHADNIQKLLPSSKIVASGISQLNFRNSFEVNQSDNVGEQTPQISSTPYKHQNVITSGRSSQNTYQQAEAHNRSSFTQAVNNNSAAKAYGVDHKASSVAQGRKRSSLVNAGVYGRINLAHQTPHNPAFSQSPRQDPMKQPQNNVQQHSTISHQLPSQMPTTPSGQPRISSYYTNIIQNRTSQNATGNPNIQNKKSQQSSYSHRPVNHRS